MSGTQPDAVCQVCLLPATAHHEVLGALCQTHAAALADAVQAGADPLEVAAKWRARMIAGALDYLDTQGPPGAPRPPEEGSPQ